MNILLIINPCSGRMKIKGTLFEVIQILCKAGHRVTTHMTTKKGNATDVASTAKADGYDMVVCCGGDGTLNEVITGVIRGGEDIPIGHIPAGSTNDFARTLGLEPDIKKATKAIANYKEEFSIDIGQFSNSHYFCYIASFGMFTASSYNTPQTAKNALGHMAYVFDGIANITNIETYKVRFIADGIAHEGEYIYGGITNSTSVGGMFKYSDNLVDLSDGLFEILMIKKPKNPNELMRIVTGITSGDVSDSKVFDFCKASNIELFMPGNVTWSLDGEYARGKTSMVIKNIPKKIRMIR